MAMGRLAKLWRAQDASMNSASAGALASMSASSTRRSGKRWKKAYPSSMATVPRMPSLAALGVNSEAKA
jgi:hypothetical protein